MSVDIHDVRELVSDKVAEAIAEHLSAGMSEALEHVKSECVDAVESVDTPNDADGYAATIVGGTDDDDWDIDAVREAISAAYQAGVDDMREAAKDALDAPFESAHYGA